MADQTGTLQPAGEHPSAVPGQAYLAVGVVCVLALAAATVALVRTVREPLLKTNTERSRWDRRRLEVIGLLVAPLALIAAIARAVLVPITAGNAFVPVLDLVTLTWCAVAALGVLLPIVPQITIGEFTVQLRAAEELVDDLLTEFRDWADMLAEYLADLAEISDHKAADTRMRQFINLRLVEAGEWLNVPDEDPRISVWLADEQQDCLRFAYSKEIRDPETIATPFGYDEGLMGAAFTEREIRNEVHPQEHPLFKPIPGGRVYGSLLIVPINYGETQLGVLCIDRKPVRYFDQRQINVMKFIANLIGMAIGRSLELQRTLKRP